MTSCDSLRTDFARHTPVFDEAFLNDYISDMPNQPYTGRHMTKTWKDGATRVFFDKVHIPQPDYSSAWQDRDAVECGANSCNPPKSFVDWGTTRDSYGMENKTLYSKLMCLDYLRQIPDLPGQIAAIYKVLRSMPLGFMGDFLRTRFDSYHDEWKIVGSAFSTFTPTTANTNRNLTTVDLGSAANLPTSELTWTMLGAYGQEMGMRGYDQDSGLSSGMLNLVTHPRTYQKLVGLNPEIRSQLHTVGVPQLSPLYMPGKGINADPFGQFAPTFDNMQVRFQHAGNGVLQRVFPYTNVVATTGHKPEVNQAYLNARYALSNILHPKAAALFTAAPKKIHESIPSINTSMWGTWKFHNPDGTITWPNPDGSTCTKSNELQWWFGWFVYLEAGFKYEQRDLVMPLLHLIDGSGQACAIDQPVCGAAPQYVPQNYTSNPSMCDA